MNTTFQLNPKGLLTAIVAVLLSGQALAETAGRVNFVVGDVSAVSTDGSRRTLSRGDLVNSGERLETGKGRLQIRFTDGSFVSLQPNTVFGLDRYTFTKSNPTDGTLLFNFVRGGMRTVSGAIGKVNRANYKVQTPSATIGIRGTGYAATQSPDGRLLLTVSKGMVNLANNFGNSNVPAGQTFQVDSSKAPEKAPAGVSVEARADTPESDGEVKQKGQEKEDSAKEQNQVATQNDDDKAPDLAAGDQASADGNPLFASAIQTTNGVPRLSSFGSLLKGSSETQIYGNVLGLYSDLSPDGKTVGNLLGLIGTAGDIEGKVILATPNGLKSLNFANVQQIGSLSFGEWTNGTAKSVDSYLQSNGLTLSNTQFMPYIVGTTAEKSLGNNLKVSYRLVGNTPVRAGLGVGLPTDTLNKLNIDIDLNFVPLVSVDLALSLAKVNYTAQLINNVLPVSFDNLSGFVLSGVDTNFFATSSNSAICANNKCPVNLSAFLSSTDIGVVYEIQRTGLSTIGGVAALTGTESTVTSQIPALDRLPSRLETQYTAIFSSAKTTLSTPPARNLAAVFDSTTGKLLSAFHTTTQDAELKAIDIYGPEQASNDVAATTKDIGHFQKVLAWGMWSNGAVALGETDDTGAPITHSLGNTNIHYMIGLPTTANTLPRTGAVLYSFVGGTTPQAAFATTQATVNDIGVMNSRSSLAVNFDQATAQLGMSIDGFTKAQSLQSLHLVGATTLNAGSSDLNFNNLTVTATNTGGGALVCTSCTGQAIGSFMGAVTPVGITGASAPQGVGLSYNITGTAQDSTPTGFNVDGVAAFGNPINNPIVTKPAI